MKKYYFFSILAVSFIVIFIYSQKSYEVAVPKHVQELGKFSESKGFVTYKGDSLFCLHNGLSQDSIYFIWCNSALGTSFNVYNENKKISNYNDSVRQQELLIFNTNSGSMIAYIYEEEECSTFNLTGKILSSDVEVTTNPNGWTIFTHNGRLIWSLRFYSNDEYKMKPQMVNIKSREYLVMKFYPSTT